MPYPASYFRLSMFRQCRQRYKLHYVDDLAKDYRKPRPYLTMGDHVRGALRDLFLLPVEERSEDRLIQLMRDRWRRNRQGFADRTEEKLYGEWATAQLCRFAQSEDLTAQPLAVWGGKQRPYLMWIPEMAREMTRRWISDVPSKIV